MSERFCDHWLVGTRNKNGIRKETKMQTFIISKKQFKRLMKIISRERTLQRKAERKNKRLERLLHEVFG